jgi:RES domain-containing protein
MLAWRIVSTSIAASAISGEGARRYGGRWNSPGVGMVYTAATLSLAALEILANLDDYALLAKAFSCIRLEFNPVFLQTLPASALPTDWQRTEHPECKRLGDAWIAAAVTPVLAVPSAVIPLETNYLLNPAHPDFTKITASPPQPFPFDPRLTK